jgi:TetR/AcrR family transcriptional repressor of nem operon
MKQADRAATTRNRILEAALKLIRTKGFNATTVDDLCVEAGVTKGAFFHHFVSKEQMAEEAAKHFSDMAEGLFSTAPFASIDDPLDRFLGYIEFRRKIIAGTIPDFTCLLGTLVQEVHDTHPTVRDACERYLSRHADGLVPMIEAARLKHVPDAPWTAESMALYTQAVLQGAFILAKAKQDPRAVTDAIEHLRRYILCAFHKA